MWATHLELLASFCLLHVVSSVPCAEALQRLQFGLLALTAVMQHQASAQQHQLALGVTLLGQANQSIKHVSAEHARGAHVHHIAHVCNSNGVAGHMNVVACCFIA